MCCVEQKIDTSVLQEEFRKIVKFPSGSNVKRVPSMTFIMGDRQKEKWKLYLQLTRPRPRTRYSTTARPDS